MSEDDTSTEWLDPDDGPEVTEEMFRRAEHRVGGKLIKPATGTMTRDFTPAEIQARRQLEEVTVKLDRHVIDCFRDAGPDWPDRMNAALRKVVEAA